MMNYAKRKLRTLLGSARASRAVDGTLAGNSFAAAISFGEAPNDAREGACAPRKES